MIPRICRQCGAEMRLSTLDAGKARSQSNPNVCWECDYLASDKCPPRNTDCACDELETK